MKTQNKKAFTLVELIITITILAILATIGFMSYQQYTNEARDGNRITTLKTIYDGLTISYIKKQIYPTPDDYIDIVGVSKQGYVGETITQKLRGEGFKDPKDNTKYLYSLDYTGKKIQLSGYLENKDKILFSEKNTIFLNQVFAGNVDYTNRYMYTIGNNVGILLKPETNAPINETIPTGSIDLQSDTQEYKVVFSSTGTITGTGTSLLEDISIIQTNSTTLSDSLNCTATTYNGYSIPNISHGLTQSVSKVITGGTSNIETTCTNGVLSYGAETTTCSTNYTLTGNSCVANTQNVACTGLPTNASWNTATNITQTWDGTIWLPSTTGVYNTTASTTSCNYKCTTSYHTENSGVSCISDTKSCTITNGVGSQTWNTTTNTRGTCTVVSCNTGYTISGNTCVASFTCGTSTVTAGGFSYNTKLVAGKCRTSTNMKHVPSTGASRCYNNIASNCITYGRLYNWTAAIHSSVCGALGTGWSLPTNAQWTALTTAGATGWTGNKLLGLASVLAGSYYVGGTFYENGVTSGWWSSTSVDSIYAMYTIIDSTSSSVGNYEYNKPDGWSVICIKN